MPNPTGTNGDGVARFDGFASEPEYGAKKKQGDLQRTAPTAGGPGAASALNAPRRAQRRAVSPQSQDAAPVAAPAGMTGVPAAVGFWQQVSQLPGVSPLVMEIANAALN